MLEGRGCPAPCPSPWEVTSHPKDKGKAHRTEKAQGEDPGGAQGADPRGLEDGVERLRGQLRETAQSGQADRYGGDQIEDTAAGGMRQAEHRAERLLGKGKKKRGGHPADTVSNEPPASTEGTPAHGPAEQRPRIKTREAAGPSSATPAQEPSTRVAAKPTVKTKGIYLQRGSAPPTEPFAQGGQGFMREQGRIAARDQAQQRRRPEGTSSPQSGSRSAPARKAGGNSYASPHPSSSSGAPAHRTVPEHTAPGKGLYASKRSPRPPRGAAKTAEHTSRQSIKTADQTVKMSKRAASAAHKTMRAAAGLTRYTAQARPGQRP